ncbi:MAG: hypothetical protein ACR2RL_07785, partial [Gammaproteobacteria bacterium]
MIDQRIPKDGSTPVGHDEDPALADSDYLPGGWQRAQALEIYASRSRHSLGREDPGAARDGAAREWTDRPKIAASNEPPSEDRSVLDTYVAATRDVPLLTKEQEVVLGREMRENRAAWTEALSPIPCAIDLFLSAL